MATPKPPGPPPVPPKMSSPPDPPSPIRVAACHAAPVFLDATATTRKAIQLIYTAAANNANLIVFPETYIPAFPIWSSLRPPTQNHDLFKRMATESIYADGPEVFALQSAARATKTYVSVGISERARYSTGTLFNSNLLIGPDGRVLVHHRKLSPTFFEKLTWAAGDGAGLKVVGTPWGNVGQLICGENTNPLARYTLMAQGEMLHISTWPAVWPTRVDEEAIKKKMKALKMADEDAGEEGDDDDAEDAEEPEDGDDDDIEKEEGEEEDPDADPDADADPDEVPKVKKSKPGPKLKTYDNVAANRTRAAAHCFEAKAFGVLCAAHLDAGAIAAVSTGSPDPNFIQAALSDAPRGVTMFLDATGAAIQGFTVDETRKHIDTDYLQNEEGILYADLDLGECVEGKQFHDVVGGYQRHDVFQLRVNRERLVPVRFRDPVEEEQRQKEHPRTEAHNGNGQWKTY